MEQKKQPRRFLVIIKAKHQATFREAWDCPEALVARVARSYDGLNATSASGPPGTGRSGTGKSESEASGTDALGAASALGCRVMAVDRWDSRAFLIFDRYHDTYDFETAHLDGRNNLPVTTVFMQKDGTFWFKQDAAVERVVNADLQEAHACHGWNIRPPFKINHMDGWYPVFRANRDMGRDHARLGPDVTYSQNA